MAELPIKDSARYELIASFLDRKNKYNLHQQKKRGKLDVSYPESVVLFCVYSLFNDRRSLTDSSRDEDRDRIRSLIYKWQAWECGERTSRPSLVAADEIMSLILYMIWECDHLFLADVKRAMDGRLDALAWTPEMALAQETEAADKLARDRRRREVADSRKNTKPR